MDNHLEQDALIEDALKTYPLAKMPCDITASVLARILKDKRPALIAWNDFVLSLVIALCIGTLLFAVQNLPPILLVKLRIQAVLVYQDLLVNTRWLIPAGLFGLAVFFFALTFPTLYRMAMDHGR